MIRVAAIACMTIGLSGCVTFDWFRKPAEPIRVEKQAVERTRLDLPDPKPIRPSTHNWIVITPKNADKIWAELRAKNVDLVLFALTDDGYEELAVDMAQIRTFIQQQRDIIIRYRDYYEPAKPAAEEKR